MNPDERNNKRDYSISCARFVAMCFIFACHVMQRDGFATDINGAHIEWAFWFNVGLQMFLFMSGYLHGKKNKTDILGFYKKGFSKLLVDYYVFVLIMIAVILLTPVMSIEKSDVTGLLTLTGTVKGLDHLWFILLILFCYLLTPFYLKIINAIDKRGNVRFILESLLMLIIIHVIVRNFLANFSAAWMNCFVIGMIYSRIENRKTIKTAFNILSALLCLIMLPVQFRIDYWPHEELPGFAAVSYLHFAQYAHVFLGITLIIFIRFIYRKLSRSTKKHYLLDWSDKYSYDVYLVHHVFVQSAFGIVEFISNRWIAIPVAIAATILVSVLLHVISEFIRRGGFSIFQKISKERSI